MCNIRIRQHRQGIKPGSCDSSSKGIVHVCVWPHVPRASTDDSDKELQACAGLWIEVNMPSKDAQNKQQRVFITVAQLKAMCERPEWTSKVSFVSMLCVTELFPPRGYANQRVLYLLFTLFD